MIPKLPFGRTGHQSSRVIFVAGALGLADERTAGHTLETLLEHGVNHVETSTTYTGSEAALGRFLTGHPGAFFIATKTLERSREKARDDLMRSLDRLRVDRLDLWQLYSLVQPSETAEALAPGGAMEALLEARESGLARAIGVTGQSLAAPAAQLRLLERVDLDAVLLPYNWPLMQLPAYAADFEALYALCREREVAVHTIESIARRMWGERSRTHHTWYEPLAAQTDIDAAVHWVLSRPGVFLNTVSDLDLVPLVLDAAERFAAPPSDAQMRSWAARLGVEPLPI